MKRKPVISYLNDFLKEKNDKIIATNGPTTEDLVKEQLNICIFLCSVLDDMFVRLDELEEKINRHMN